MKFAGKIISSLLLVIIALMIYGAISNLWPTYGLLMSIIGAMPMILIAIIVIIMIAKW